MHFYFQKYQEMKLHDLSSKTSVASSEPSRIQRAPVLQTQEGAPVVVNNSGKPVSIPTFEGSSGVPSTPSDNQVIGKARTTAYTRISNRILAMLSLALMRHKFKAESRTVRG